MLCYSFWNKLTQCVKSVNLKWNHVKNTGSFSVRNFLEIGRIIYVWFLYGGGYNFAVVEGFLTFGSLVQSQNLSPIGLSLSPLPESETESESSGSAPASKFSRYEVESNKSKWVWARTRTQPGPREVNKFGFCRDVPLQKLKVDPYKYQFFKIKWPLYLCYTLPNFEQNRLILQKFSYIWANFGLNLGKFWKVDPFKYQILCLIRGHSYTKRLILLPMLMACPRRVFCTGYPRIFTPEAERNTYNLTSVRWHTMSHQKPLFSKTAACNPMTPLLQLQLVTI